MRKELTTTASVTIAARPDVVWEWLTDADLVEQYFFGTRLSADWKKGGKIFFRGNWEGKSYEDRGTILKIDPPKLLRFDYWSNMSGKPDIPENYIDLTYDLTEANGRTTVTLTQRGAESEEALAHSQNNWKIVLEELKKHVEAAGR